MTKTINKQDHAQFKKYDRRRYTYRRTFQTNTKVRERNGRKGRASNDILQSFLSFYLFIIILPLISSIAIKSFRIRSVVKPLSLLSLRIKLQTASTGQCINSIYKMLQLIHLPESAMSAMLGQIVKTWPRHRHCCLKEQNTRTFSTFSLM